MIRPHSTMRWALVGLALSLLACQTPTPITSSRPRIAGTTPKPAARPTPTPAPDETTPPDSGKPLPSQEPPPAPIPPPAAGGGGTRGGGTPTATGSPVLGLVAGTQPADTWLASAPLQRARAGLAAAVLGDRLYALEGANSPSRESYAPGELAWLVDETYDLAQTSNTTTALRNGRSLIAVGLGADVAYTAGGTNGLGLLNTAVRYDADAVSTEQALLTTEVKAAAGGLLSDFLVVAGGVRTDGAVSVATQRANVATSAKTAGATMPLGVAGAASVAIGTKLYVLGGYTLTGATPTAQKSVQVYDLTGNAWRRDGDAQATPPAPLPEARHSAAAAVLGGKIYMAGGVGADGAVLGSMIVYDPATNAWSAKLPMRTPRALLALAAYQGKLWAIGGFDANQRMLTSVETYQP